MTSTLTGFIRGVITPVGIVTLSITFDNEPKTKTFVIPFMMVDLPSTYNIPRLENSRADALAQLASTDTVDELPTIPSLYRPMVAIFETVTMVAHPG
ncbi:hypothetical protein B296_00015729 [Ensete ventricosum]|uniref:Uncharacterized protein n=1 Tax=Ensete ventricosum TaxID=4639 RepID=A0A426ZTV3_ENSVE|nr:hypothetical protein B296_00015729 [Ensete ventricosum]